MQKVTIIPKKSNDKLMCVTKCGIMYSSYSYFKGPSYNIIDYESKKTKINMSDELKAKLSDITMRIREYSDGSVIGAFMDNNSYIIIKLNRNIMTFEIIAEIKADYYKLDDIPFVVPIILDIKNNNIYISVNGHELPKLYRYNLTTNKLTQVNYTISKNDIDTTKSITIHRLFMDDKIILKKYCTARINCILTTTWGLKIVVGKFRSQVFVEMSQHTNFTI